MRSGAVRSLRRTFKALAAAAEKTMREAGPFRCTRSSVDELHARMAIVHTCGVWHGEWRERGERTEGGGIDKVMEI
jgi:hypothetical protein